MVSLQEWNTQARPTWCPGCGNFGIWNGVKRALVSVNAEPNNTVFIGGVGCSGKIPHWVNAYGFHGLHGRTLPVATGIKLANHKLTVIAEGGDGDGYDEGTNHLIHACRRNINITYIVHNNQVFGLTKGQTSPTADPGYVSSTSPWGSRELPINPLALTLAAHASFVARTFAADLEHVSATIAEAIKHEGFAIVDILQPCVTFNKHNTFDWYNKRVYKIGPNESGRGKHDPSDFHAAMKRSQEWGDAGIPIGIFYQEKRTDFGVGMPQLKKGPLVEKDLTKCDNKDEIKKLF
ncbi:2-oxoacid ferredoxin oxidoreductase [Candidatus Woesearchaeota archaeon]|nr:2-oxoacid ferredoxin oxidoreductase [Candidatus Woesearchaeota archaeon]